MSKVVDFTSNPAILDDYLEYLKNTKNFSAGTVSGYEIDLKIFFNFIISYKEISIPFNKISIFTISQINGEDIIAFLTYINYYNVNTANTRNRKLAAIKSFFNYIYRVKNYMEKENPTIDLPSIQKLKRLPKYLTLKQAKEIQNVFNETNCRNYIRNNTILTLFLTTGIRLSELLKIDLQDIDFNNNTINIYGKGNKQRVAYIPEFCKKKILEYISIRNRTNPPCAALFISSKNKRISKMTIEYICKKAYKLMGLEDKNYTVHTLRHTAATIYFEYNNRDILLLKEILGHSSIASTEVYTHTYNDLAKEAVMKNPLSEYKVT